jgi:hypothetical protein
MMRRNRGTYTTSKWNELYIKEKKILTRIAALKQIYVKKLSSKIIKNDIVNLEGYADQPALENILKSYFYLKEVTTTSS